MPNIYQRKGSQRKVRRSHKRGPYKKKKTRLERFLAFVRPVETGKGCLEWYGALDEQGYGRFDGGMAHRAAFRFFKGAIPPGMQVCHTCHNRCCVNPLHLLSGTAQFNTDMRKASGKSLRGENNGMHIYSGLTEKKIKQIHRLYMTGDITQQQLADAFGVSRTSIVHILQGRKWGWVEGERAPKMDYRRKPWRRFQERVEAATA